MKKKITVVVVILSLIVILTIVIGVCNWSEVSLSFFQFTLFDVASYFTSITLGFYLAYVLSVTAQKEGKRNEIIVEVITAVFNSMDEIKVYILYNRNKKITIQTRQKVLTLVHLLYQNLAIFNTVMQNIQLKSNIINNIEKLRTKFNNTVTGDALLVGGEFNNEYVINVLEDSLKIRQALFSCKIELYMSGE